MTPTTEEMISTVDSLIIETEGSIQMHESNILRLNKYLIVLENIKLQLQGLLDTPSADVAVAQEQAAKLSSQVAVLSETLTLVESERDGANTALATAIAERDAKEAELTAVTTERDALAAERDALTVELSAVKTVEPAPILEPAPIE